MEVVRRECEVRGELLEQAVAGAADADELIDALVRSFEEILGEGSSEVVMFYELFTLGQRNGEIAAELAELAADPRLRLADALRAGSEAGVFELRADPDRRRQLPARARRRRHDPAAERARARRPPADGPGGRRRSRPAGVRPDRGRGDAPASRARRRRSGRPGARVGAAGAARDRRSSAPRSAGALGPGAGGPVSTPSRRSSCCGITPTGSSCGSGATARRPGQLVKPAWPGRRRRHADASATRGRRRPADPARRDPAQARRPAHRHRAGDRGRPPDRAADPSVGDAGGVGRRQAHAARDRVAVRVTATVDATVSAQDGKLSWCPTSRSAGWPRSRSSPIRTSRCRAWARRRPPVGSSCAPPPGCTRLPGSAVGAARRGRAARGPGTQRSDPTPGRPPRAGRTSRSRGCRTRGHRRAGCGTPSRGAAPPRRRRARPSLAGMN